MHNFKQISSFEIFSIRKCQILCLENLVIGQQSIFLLLDDSVLEIGHPNDEWQEK